MRTPKEIFNMIMNIANADEHIRAVLLGGSRANPDCPIDIYQDFDIVFFVDDLSLYWDNEDWIEEKFGKPSLIQKPESMTLSPPDNDGNFAYLMIFPDGNRIDLQIKAKEYLDDGEPVRLLLDKDGTFPKIEVKESYWYIEKPSQKLFCDCCNEFYWCLNNVAKGIARDELSYAMEQFNHYVRDMLIQMLNWYIGVNNDFEISAGKNGKYFKKLLPPDIYTRFTETYSDSENLWKAVYSMFSLFKDVARIVSEKLGYEYNEAEEKGIANYMRQVKEGLLKYD